MDLFEVLFGYEYSFGLYYVDFNDPNRTRYAKLSQKWYSGFLKGKNVTIDDEQNQLPKNMTSILANTVDTDNPVFS